MVNILRKKINFIDQIKLELEFFSDVSPYDFLSTI